MSSKQDLQGARTVAQLEQKYNYDKRFAEIMGVATGARKMAEEVENRFNETMTSEEIFNILTDNGKTHGLFRGEDGELYVNAQYIVALEYLFAKDIEMSGKFTYKMMTFLEPEQAEIDTIQKHVLGIATIPASKISLYDFNNDGQVNSLDALAAQKAMLGMISLADWSGAVESEVTLTIDLKNPQKAFRIEGTNMWGRQIDSYMGVRGISVKHTETADYVVEKGTSDGGSITWNYEKWASGKAVCWGTAYTAYSNGNVTETNFDYPFSFIETPCIFATINTEDNSTSSLHRNAKAFPRYSSGRVFVHDALGGFTAGTQIDVSVYVIGKWK